MMFHGCTLQGAWSFRRSWLKPSPFIFQKHVRPADTKIPPPRSLAMYSLFQIHVHPADRKIPPSRSLPMYSLLHPIPNHTIWSCYSSQLGQFLHGCYYSRQRCKHHVGMIRCTVVADENRERRPIEVWCNTRKVSGREDTITHTIRLNQI